MLAIANKSTLNTCKDPLVILQVIEYPINVMPDKDAGTPRVFIARHGTISSCDILITIEQVLLTLIASDHIGETEWTKSGQYTGITELELTPHGVTQVQNSGRVLVGTGKLIDPSRIAHVYVSPRKRAQKTCELLFSSPSDSTDNKVSTTDRLAEWGYGEYEGMVTSQIRALRKEHGLDTERPWDIWRDGCEGGEYVMFEANT